MWREAEADGGQYRGPPTRGLTSEDEAKLQIFSDLTVFFFLFHFFSVHKCDDPETVIS